MARLHGSKLLLLGACAAAAKLGACYDNTDATPNPAGNGGTTSFVRDASADEHAARTGTLRLVNAATTSASDLTWSLAGDDSPRTTPFGTASDGVQLEAGTHRLHISQSGASLPDSELEIREGGATYAVLVSDDSGATTLRVIEPPGAEAGTDATLHVVNASSGQTFAIDVGNDDPSAPELTLAPNGVSPDEGVALDPTRPALALALGQDLSRSFSLPRPAAQSAVVAIVLGDAHADGLASDGLRLLVVASDGFCDDTATPELYTVHASEKHAGLDVFIARRNPLLATLGSGALVGKPAYAPDLRINEPRVLAELSDDLRFGALATSTFPPGPASLDVFLTIPGSAQAPSPVNFSLVSELLPNQRLRNGWAVGRQGGQVDETSELRAGAEYLLILTGNRLLTNHRDPNVEPAALVPPMERLGARALGDGKFGLRVAPAFAQSDVQLSIDGKPALHATDWAVSAWSELPAGPHTVDVTLAGGASKHLAFTATAGQDLLVLPAGYVALPDTPHASPARDDDADEDTFVSSPLDPNSGAPTDPNYLPPDGDSSLNQDDCPDQPGPSSGCPAPAFQWLVIDTSVRPPAVQLDAAD